MLRFVYGSTSVLGICLVILAGAACSGGSGGSAPPTMSWQHPAGTSDALSVAGSDSTNPVAAIDTEGNIVTTWVQTDGADNRVYLSEFRSGAWTRPSSLDDAISPAGTQAFGPTVAAAPNGEAIVAWEQSDGGKVAVTHIYLSERTAGAWYNPADLNDYISPAADNAAAPAAVMAENGDALVVWKQWDGSNWQVYASERRGGTWADPEDLSPDGEDVEDIAVVMNETGDAVVAWRQADTDGDKQLFLSECRSGIWTKPAGLSNSFNPAGSEVNNLALAMNVRGDTLVVWEQKKDGFWQIYKREYFNGSWNHPGVKDNISPAGTDALGIGLAMNDGGAATIAWEQVNGGVKRIYKAERRFSKWTFPQFADAISPIGTAARYPRVAISESGATVIAWEQSDGDFNQIYKSHFRNAAWTHPQGLLDHVSPGGTEATFLNGQLAMAADGECMIVWEQFDGANWQIFKSQYRDGLWFVPPTVLNYFSLDGFEAQNPNLAMEPGAQAVVVWQQSDGKNERIFASDYR